MRIALIGQAAFGADVLKGLLKQGQEVAGVFCPPDRGSKTDPLKDAALAAGIPVYQPPRMRDPQAYEADGGPQPRPGGPGLCHRHRPGQGPGRPQAGLHLLSPLHSAPIPRRLGHQLGGDQRRTGTGLTIFWVDEGIDTGDILLQKTVEIGPTETTGELYFNKLYPLGVEACLEAVDLVAQGKAPRIPQDHSLGTYDPPCDEKVAALNWNQPGRQVFNFIRGCDPQPGATTTFRGEQVKLYNASFLMDDHTAPPGEILEVTDKGIKVAVSGAALLITRFRTKDLGKVKAPEFVEAKKPRPGDRFGAPAVMRCC